MVVLAAEDNLFSNRLFLVDCYLCTTLQVRPCGKKLTDQNKPHPNLHLISAPILFLGNSLIFIFEMNQQ